MGQMVMAPVQNGKGHLLVPLDHLFKLRVAGAEGVGKDDA
jgi:hypothetical protein